jgi:uracil-DNA glycosylase
MAQPKYKGAGQWVPTRGGVPSLRAAAQKCRGCDLWKDANQVVVSSGTRTARLMLVGETPGDVEDKKGEVFVGPAGRLLDHALDAVGIARADAYLTNAVKHFRFTTQEKGKRRLHQTPTLAQMRACQPWLERELVLVDPEVVVVMGSTAASALLGPSFRVTAHRGELIPRPDADGVDHGWYVPTVHPAAVLRANDQDKAYAYFVADLQVAADALGRGKAGQAPAR